jgi:hypothetical protein
MGTNGPLGRKSSADGQTIEIMRLMVSDMLPHDLANPTQAGMTEATTVMSSSTTLTLIPGSYRCETQFLCDLRDLLSMIAFQ